MIIFFKKSLELSPLDGIIKAFNKNQKARHRSKQEELLIGQIRQRTSEANLNNITRTKAYMDFYRLHPEIHWALLAHLVSRNGGWNMTDLKGELLSRLLSKKEKQSFFTFLERANWLIFQDAYPQLLLYKESINRKTPFFHLLPSLNISGFMEPFWNQYWEERNSSILTIALIINEQNYIEDRVVQNPFYKNEVIDTLEFQLNQFLSMNHILFPYNKNESIRLAGQTVSQFESLNRRILFGKQIYRLLFGDNSFLRNVEKWAFSHPHTGSRKDYWPHIFNNVREGLPGLPYQLRLSSCQLRPGARRLYSPYLEHTWKNVSHKNAEEGDWYTGQTTSKFFTDTEGPINGDIETDYCNTLEKLELAALAKKVISFFD
ncbi:hypothetical protein A8F94_13005 [Bacillus sp. FJAT-27225]|uniref:DUF2515 domain-containing protein n=1 Tax=Bacillus sp. FJAT-27225 TaxID=1743144 RepID=UPI00080C235D|nr:DUF2515 domain-containing protein [Bacillus sp. FJAT-27225]OCA85786.1 hypothetical protein A8F94_13005 [Bacillus sp. FJAT-27225]